MVGQVSIGVNELVRERRGEPEIEATLVRRQYPPEPARTFSPLRIPEDCQVILRGPLIRACLRRSAVRATLTCRPGSYQVPLASGPPCEVELVSGSQIFARLEVGSGPAETGPVVRAVDLRFAPSLRLHNLLQTLNQIHELLDDRYLALVKPLTPYLPRWLRALGGTAIGSADSRATILLEHASARSTLGPDPLMRWVFSGRVRMLDQVEVPFEQVSLPSTILPVPHAALERLLSSDPFATASVAEAVPDPVGLVKTLLDTVDHAEGEITADLEPPAVRITSDTIDGINLSCVVRSPGAARLEAGFTATQVDGDTLDLRVDGATLAPTDGSARLEVDLRARLELDLERSDDGDGRGLLERSSASVELDLAAGSTWRQIDIDLGARETLCQGEAEIPLQLQEVELEGGLSLELGSEQLRLQPSRAARVSGRAVTRDPYQLRRAQAQLSGAIVEPAELEGTLEPRPDGIWLARLGLRSKAAAQLSAHVTGLPELDLKEGDLRLQLDAGLVIDLESELRVGQPDAGVDLSGSLFAMQIEQSELELDQRRITLPTGTSLSGRMIHGALSTSGPREIALNLRWDLHGQPCLLHYRGEAVSLLSPDLRQGNLVLHLDSAGKLSFTGQREGLYGVRYFNALLNPAGDPEQLQELLRSDDAVAHVVGALNAFNPDLAEQLTDLQALWRAARLILKREGIEQPGDFIPRTVMARIFSLLLTGTDRLQERLIPIIKQVTDGQGMDLPAVKELLQKELGELDIDYEIGFAINWLNLVLSPTEPLEPASVTHELPLVLDPAFEQERRGLPSAGEIYERVGQGEVDAEFGRRLADLAPRLSAGQLGYILERVGAGWDPRLQARLKYVYEVKRRVDELAAGYGGVEYALQPLMISSFLGEAVGPLPGFNVPGRRPVDADAWPPPLALGPEEVATLLMAGLASAKQDSRTQLNNRMLLELLRTQEPAFTQAVFVEMGHQSPRALSGILYAFLGQDLDQLAEPVDLVALLEQKLGLPIPRQTDYLAGGRKARKSYYEALSRLADQIIEEANPYLAAKQHLQQVRYPVPAPVAITSSDAEKLERRARESIDRADRRAAECRFDGQGRGGPRQRSREAYRRALSSCARLLAQEPRAFQLPWLKTFWSRNEEALKVLSVVRNYQEGVDQVRRWLQIRSCRDSFADEQDLLRTVVRTCYWEEEHREALLADPLIRLLIDPEPGHYSFTIVGCMGVITEGKEGAELVDAFTRLEQRRGIRIIRAHTGTARSLEYNAQRIIEAIERCTTPWGIIGYSQGCANALMAENLLLGGTPAQQRLLDGLVCRNLLFSSANGSAHGTCGMLKFRRAMDLGERYLKHYQALYSREAVENVLRIFKGVLDSKPFVAVLGGADSLTFERARVLHRDGQFLDRVPTSYTRGVVTEEGVPEMLEFLFYMLRAQHGAGDQDSQVMITDAIGHSTLVSNDYTDLLKRCDMGSLPQATHHWATLTKEIEFVTTERDRVRAVYESPKDRLVWPWVEVNARFGRIERV